MAKNANFVSHKKSKQIVDGKPKLPLASDIVEGEIAINFGKDVETLSIKNESGDVVTFSCDNYYTEKKLGSGFTGENSANTVTSVVGSGFTSSSITDVIIENEEIVSAALTDLDERKLDASAYTPIDLSNYYTKDETSGKTEISTALGGKSNTGHTHVIGNITNLQTTLDGKANTATTLAGYGITNAYTKSETSGATEISNALSGKVNTSDIISAITPSNSGSTAPIATKVVAENELVMSNALNDLNTAITAHTASTVHMNNTEKTNLDSLATNIGTISGITSTDKLIHETMNRRTRTNFTSNGLEWFKNTLKSAIADKSLEKYGLKVGDYYTVTHDGKTYNYVIAGFNTMRGTSTPYRLNYDHVGIIVDTNDTHAWNTSNRTSASTNTHSTDGTWTSGTSAAGYASCDLQYYLETTVLSNVESDLGASNLKGHSKLYSTAVNPNGYNRFGSADGCSSSWAWYSNQKICALSEVQVYGSIVWSSSGYDTGEACRQLDVFRVYNMNEIFEGRYPWLRDVASSSAACYVSGYGLANLDYAVYIYYVAALILFA